MLTEDEFSASAQPIQWLILDVDGVLTDGSIQIDSRGEEIKRFSVKDGFGIRCWQACGKQTAVITGRSSAAVAYRCRDLDIDVVVQGARDKKPAYRKLLADTGMSASQVCFLGDDLPDLPLILASGLGATVANADAEVRGKADWITKAPGGEGAARELIESILRAQSLWDDFIERYRQPA